MYDLIRHKVDNADSNQRLTLGREACEGLKAF